MERQCKTSFIVYDSVLEALEAFGDKAKAFDAILAMRAYNAALSDRVCFDENKYLVDPMVRMVFTMQAPSIRANFIKWLESCLRNRRNRISSELKKEGRIATEEDVRAHLRAIGELDDYLATERYIHALRSLPSGKLIPDPPPMVTAGHQWSPVVTDKDKETVSDTDKGTDTETVAGAEADSGSDYDYEKGEGFGGGAGGGQEPRIRCPQCGFECAATTEPDGVTHAWCPQCGDFELREGEGQWTS